MCRVKEHWIHSPTKEVLWLATLHVGPYWARWVVRDIQSISWSCQLSFRFLKNSELEDNCCRVSHTEERPVLLLVSGEVIILGMKTTISTSILCTPGVTREIGFPQAHFYEHTHRNVKHRKKEWQKWNTQETSPFPEARKIVEQTLEKKQPSYAYVTKKRKLQNENRKNWTNL